MSKSYAEHMWCVFEKGAMESQRRYFVGEPGEAKLHGLSDIAVQVCGWALEGWWWKAIYALLGYGHSEWSGRRRCRQLLHSALVVAQA